MGGGVPTQRAALWSVVGSPIAGLISYQHDAAKEQQKQLAALANQKPPVPTPPPTPADNNPTETVADRQKKLAAMQYGFASTVSNMSPQNPTGLKNKTGQ